MELNLTSPINNLGYGVTGLNILKGLVRNQCTVSYWPIGSPSVSNQEDAQLVRQSMDERKFFNSNAPSLRIWHQNDMAQHIGKGRRVGFPIFELNRFSKMEKHQLTCLDNIIVCSEWAKSVVEDEIPFMRNRVGVAPLGVDTYIFNHQKANKTSKKTIFFNAGKWEVRKGHDILCDAFNKAFSEKDNVELWMMNDNPFLEESAQKEWHKLYLESKLGSKIKIIPRVNTHEEVAEIMAMTDVGVFPSRAEGWNLEALEMMSMGKYVIITDFSAHAEFATHINSKLISIDETEKAYDGIWFHGDGEWASIGESQIEQLVTHMRTLHECKQSDIENGRLNKNERGIVTAQKFSWENSAKKVMQFCGV